MIEDDKPQGCADEIFVMTQEEIEEHRRRLAAGFQIPLKYLEPHPGVSEWLAAVGIRQLESNLVPPCLTDEVAGDE